MADELRKQMEALRRQHRVRVFKLNENRMNDGRAKPPTFQDTRQRADERMAQLEASIERAKSIRQNALNELKRRQAANLSQLMEPVSEADLYNNADPDQKKRLDQLNRIPPRHGNRQQTMPNRNNGSRGPGRMPGKRSHINAGRPKKL